MFFSCTNPDSSCNTIRTKLKSPAQLEFDMFRAVFKLNLQEVGRLYQHKAPLNFIIPDSWHNSLRDSFNRMPAPIWFHNLPFIHFAAMVTYHEVPILDFLLTAGATLDEVYEQVGDDKKYTGSILHNTQFVHSNLETFKVLIAHGADVNAVNPSGVSVVTALLDTQAFRGSNLHEKLSILDLYTKNHATLTAADITQLLLLNRGHTLSNTMIRIFQTCIDHNLAQNALAEDSRKPLNDLSFSEHGSLLHFLAKEKFNTEYVTLDKFIQLVNAAIDLIDLNLQDANGRTALSLAAEYSPIVFDLIIARKDQQNALVANIELADNNGLTPLMHALKSNDNVAKLLAQNANVDAKDNNGLSVCHHAVKTRHLAKLLENGANCNVANNNGDTVCHYAADSPFLNVLFKHGVNCDLPNKAGVTPLMKALEAKHIDNATLLITHQANIWAKPTSDGRCVLDFAKHDLLTSTYLNGEMLKAQHEMGVSSSKQQLTLI